MGDYIAIRYRVKIKPEFVQKLTDAGNGPEDDAILSWNRAGLKFDDPVAQTTWRAFLDNEMSLRWPSSNHLHFNPQNWPSIDASFNSLSGVLKGTLCMKYIPGSIAALVAVLPLIATEWKVEIDTRELLFDLGSTYSDHLDTYSNRGDDLSADRRKKHDAEYAANNFGYGSN